MRGGRSFEKGRPFDECEGGFGLGIIYLIRLVWADNILHLSDQLFLSLAALLATPSAALSQTADPWTDEEIDNWVRRITSAWIDASLGGDSECRAMLGASGAGWRSDGIRAFWGDSTLVRRGAYQFNHHAIWIETDQTPEAEVLAIVHEGIHAAFRYGHRIHRRINDHADLYPVVARCAEDYFPM